MDKFQFIKHPIKENDTIESVAQHFDITTNYLQLVHNLNVDVYDKIKNSSGFFPSHLKEIFIDESTYQSFIERENEKRPKNSPILEYKPIKGKTIYNVFYTFLDDEEQTNISFQTSIEGLKSDPKINGYIVEIDRTSLTLLNNEDPELVIDELALTTAKVIYPLQIIVNYRGKFIDIKNYEEIIKRWEIVKENIRDNFESEQTEIYIISTEPSLKNKETLLASLKKDWFLNTYFSEIYINYYSKYKINKTIYFPVVSDFEGFEYAIVQEMNKYADDKNQLTISQNGKIDNEIKKDLFAINGEFEAEYLLNPVDKSIKSIFLQCSLEFETQKKLSITIKKNKKV
ncbi:hypothetical protein [Flavobacterium branchiophilum]|uniref:LysM domain-containing protein n=1 Tax=Flavobacterium branchiophilum TaxID=55197 RepID=A0A543G259_9FLAO|nr:hypothetical protein [Flavobacterium branchiophilum]TQM40183.1 hypothetical protein BC670_1055 [Flavobacterium branchiophilum]GEM56127.1 hypothetical protein FB1_23480 [Flavobacterium branchiophilum NBRC 15030 = ATCC 35035]